MTYFEQICMHHVLRTLFYFVFKFTMQFIKMYYIISFRITEKVFYPKFDLQIMIKRAF
jgi:hypothetical protein